MGTPAAAKPKKAAAPEKSADPQQSVQAVDPEAPVPLFAANVPGAQSGEPQAPRLRPTEPALPSSAAVALGGATRTAEDAGAVQDSTGSTEPGSAQAGDALLAAAAPDPAPASARDGTLASQPTLTPETRLEAAAPAEVKAASAPPAPPADHERAGEILRQVRVQFSPELRTATIQLSPPELGRISIRMRIEGGELHALVRAEKRETLDALQRHVPELKATLEQLGIQARQFDLQLGFEQQGTRQSPHEPRTGGDPASREHDPQVREHERRLLQTLSVHAGGIDTFA